MTWAGQHHSEETKAKMRAARAKQVFFPETRAKISAAALGNPHPHVGHPVMPETRVKISAAQSGEKNHQYGKPLSAETRAKMSVARRGRTFSAETRAKLSATHSGEKHYQYGKPLSPETRAKLSVATSGEKNPRWRGGISFEPYCPKWNKDLRRRIRAFFDHRCIMCGKSQAGERLSCHHVEYNKSACCDGKPVQFAALCRRHHNMTTNGDRQRWEDMMHRAIDEVYGGRSYLPKDP
jgi:hypothetical protein